MEYGLIGEKLSHSFSKTVHKELFDYNYELKEIAPQNLDSFMKKADFKAINVTIPYKQSVISYLDEIDETAKKTGAVNTVVNKNGKLFGYNTDYFGLRDLIVNAGISLSAKKVLILGSGGTSLTAKTVAEDMGAKELYRVSRTGKGGLITYEEVLKSHIDADIIINTTPCGMYPNTSEMPIDIDKFTNISGVVDAVYNPINSLLVVKAKEKGIKATGGLYMLIAQAVYAAEKFTESAVPNDTVKKIYNKIFNQKCNLVLIGMPGCGKTTIGKILAKKMSKSFIDCDEEIIKITGKTIPKIFEEYGEAYFRDLESKVISEKSKLQSCVIATGGGAVLREKNIEMLKQNGRVIFLDRPLEKLTVTDDRPLSANRELLQKRYNERYEVYLSAADDRIFSAGEIEETLSKAEEVLLSENSRN